MHVIARVACVPWHFVRIWVHAEPKRPKNASSQTLLCTAVLISACSSHTFVAQNFFHTINLLHSPTRPSCINYSLSSPPYSHSFFSCGHTTSRCSHLTSFTNFHNSSIPHSIVCSWGFSYAMQG